MKPRLQLLALGALALLLVLGLGLVFQRRLARDLYPPYSSFRADPLGSRAWHDSLASLPGFHVERSLVPPEKLRTAEAATFFFIGSSRHDWAAMPTEDFAALNSALTRGSRVVICLAAEHYAPTSELERDAAARDKLKEERLEKEKHDRTAPEPAAEPAEDTDPAHPPKPAKTAPKRPPPVDAFARWGLKIELQRDHSGRLAAQDVDDLAPPADLRWESSLVLAPEAPAQWTVVLARDGKPLWGERAVDAGTLVVLTDSFLVSNEALQRARATALLVRLAGPHRRVVFDEHHLGVAASPGIAALARRYGLMPAFGLCVLLAGLYVWRIGAAFVPPTPASAETALDYRPTSSLAALLRRAVPTKQLLPTCLAEWRRTARPGDSARADAALAGQTDPVAGYNAVVAALRRRSVTPVLKH